MKWSIRNARPEDLAEVAKLYNDDPHEEKVDVEEFKSTWKRLYSETPHPKEMIFIGADEEQKIVAHYAVMPLPFLTRGRPVVAASPSQLIVLEAFRAELLFMNLELKLLREYRIYGMDFCYGLVSKRPVLKAHLALGFKELGEVPVLALPVDFVSLARKTIDVPAISAILSPFLRGLQAAFEFLSGAMPGAIEVERVDAVPEEANRFLDKAVRSYENSSIKTAGILNWRYTNTPGRSYEIYLAKEWGEICGLIVLRHLKMRQFDVTAVADVEALPGRTDAVKALISTARAAAKKNGDDLIACLINRKDHIYQALKNCLFVKAPESFVLVAHSHKQSLFEMGEGDGPGKKDFSRLLEGWHITWFDHDYV